MNENLKDEYNKVRNALNSIVEDLLDNAKEAEKGINGDDFQKGKASAYFEIKEMIESRLKNFDVEIDK